jgi:hypothetical protein
MPCWSASPGIVAGSGSIDITASYSAALDRLSRTLAHDWVVTDWVDGTLSWRSFRPRSTPTPQQGWKIHVSASAVEGTRLLTALGGELHRLRASFKVARGISDIVFLNSGDAGAEQLGKVVTVYPRDDCHARDLLYAIDLVWPTSQGPEVQTDLHFRPGSPVSFRYGVFLPGPTIVGSTGIPSFALVFPDGSREPDRRLRNGEQSTNAPSPPVAGCPPRARPITLNELLPIDGRPYVALLGLRDTPRTSIFLGADLASLETVVLKVGRPGVAGDLSGVDVRQLLRKEFFVLCALKDQAGLAPRALRWVDGDWPILVTEDFRGDLLCDLPRRERINCLPLLADAVSRLHDAGFVHGDVKLENAVRRGSGVGLIDFELAEREGAAMRRGGTRGHLPPEVAAHVPAARARDVFALGGCIVQAVLDIPPGLLPTDPGRVRGILENEGVAVGARLVTELLVSDPRRRPTARAVASTLHACADSLVMTSPRQGRPSSEMDHRWHRRASMDSAQLVESFAVATEAGTSWRNDHFLRSFECEAINIGASGILLGLLTIDRAFGRSDFVEQIGDGARRLSARPAAGNAAGLFTGNAGVAIALALAGRRLGNAGYLAAARRRFEAACADRREIDLFSGSAGVVWAGCMLRDIVQDSWPLELIRDAVGQLRASADVLAGIPVWMGDSGAKASYLGCAHGSAGVAMALASWGGVAEDVACIEMARETFRLVARHGRTADGSALRVGPGAEHHHAVGNWCHGVAGYLWAILQGLGDDPSMRPEIDWAVECLRDAVSVGTSTYCHGLSGQLELWRMLGCVARFHELAHARAGKVARALRLVHRKVDRHCTWVSDDPEVTTPDLWVGFLGPASALAMHAAGVGVPLLSAPWLSMCAEPPVKRQS